MHAALVALALAGGCASVKPYPSDPAGNVVLRTDLDAGVRAAVYVHSVDAQCATEFQGRTLLENSPTVIAIPTDRASYLVASFDSSSLLRGSSSTSVGSLLRARPGQTYDLLLSYRSDLYQVTLREVDRQRGVSRELPRRDLGACRPS